MRNYLGVLIFASIRARSSALVSLPVVVRLRCTCQQVLLRLVLHGYLTEVSHRLISGSVQPLGSDSSGQYASAEKCL